MIASNYYLILAEMLKQQINIAPVATLFDLKSKIQLNNVGSEFESSNGIYTCIHPVTNNIINDLSVATFNIQSDKNDVISVKEKSDNLIKSAMLKHKPFFIKYSFIGWEERVSVTLSICLTDKVREFNNEEIPFILNRLFGDGETKLIEVKSLEKRDSSKDILDSYILDLKFDKITLGTKYEVFTAEMQGSPFLKRAFVTKDKGTICIFKEHVVSHIPVYETNEYAGSRFEISEVIGKVLKENSEFDSIIVEAYSNMESNDDSHVIYTFCVNINTINKGVVATLISKLLDTFGIYKFNRIVSKKLTYLDVI